MLSLRCIKLENKRPPSLSKICIPPAGPRLFQLIPLAAVPKLKFLASSKTRDMKRRDSSRVSPANSVKACWDMSPCDLRQQQLDTACCALHYHKHALFGRVAASPISLTGALRTAKGLRSVRTPTANSSAGVHVKHRLALYIANKSQNNPCCPAAAN